MTKFRCIKGTANVPVGTIIEGELQGKTIVLTKDSTLKHENNMPYFGKGEYVPLTGYVWQWESCADTDELLERFEDVVDVLASHERDIYHFGKSDIDYDEANKEYEAAREELLKHLS